MPTPHGESGVVVLSRTARLAVVSWVLAWCMQTEAQNLVFDASDFVSGGSFPLFILAEPT